MVLVPFRTKVGKFKFVYVVKVLFASLQRLKSEMDWTVQSIEECIRQGNSLTWSDKSKTSKNWKIGG